MRKKYKLIISYDGTSYQGWQVQPNGPSIQEKIQTALETVLKEKIALVGSSRTDAGVHALGQTAHFDTENSFQKEKLLYSLNGLLPHDIRLLELEEVADDFHARFSASGKVYHYHLHLDRTMDPFQRLYTYHIHKRINISLLEQAAKEFIGTHDFTSFANEASEGAAKNKPIKTMKRLDVISQKGGLRLEFEANGFLYKMVRNIVGTLLQVADGSLPLESIQSIIAVKDRRRAGPAVPPQGLFLVKVQY